ncbi:hypothetical protein [Jatrophihabitans sp.]|uniref:hypothetical protein n=1 Tax=Jatrophihabitans sp. TaxID=1932789 RepID=UPI0030C742A3|nr:hypothetical protein [Jatrophihabitans sp.]
MAATKKATATRTKPAAASRVKNVDDTQKTSRDRSARTRIRQYLTVNGPVDDPTGYATGALKEAVDYQGTAVAFIQLIASMDRDGELVREVRGKRTYRISIGRSAELLRGPAGVPAAGALSPSFDYDRLARAMVREFISQLSVPGASAEQRLRAERDEYAMRLEVARQRLASVFSDDPEALAAIVPNSVGS